MSWSCLQWCQKCDTCGRKDPLRRACLRVGTCLNNCVCGRVLELGDIAFEEDWFVRLHGLEIYDRFLVAAELKRQSEHHVINQINNQPILDRLYRKEQYLTKIIISTNSPRDHLGQHWYLCQFWCLCYHFICYPFCPCRKALLHKLVWRAQADTAPIIREYLRSPLWVCTTPTPS